jgi:hypothetical protein
MCFVIIKKRGDCEKNIFILFSLSYKKDQRRKRLEKIEIKVSSLHKFLNFNGIGP